MPEWLKILLEILKDNPQAISDLIKLIGEILKFLNEHPDLVKGVEKKLNS